MRKSFLVTLLALGCWAGNAAIVSQPVEYKEGNTILEGWSVYDDAVQGKRPAVLVVHQWKGLSDYEKKRAEMLACLGYNVLAVDIYGRGIRPQSPQAAGAEAAKYKNDRALLRARVRAGLDVLSNHKLTDPKKVVAIGYCFGGTTVLELARSGAHIAGVVSFHGGLDTPLPAVLGSVQAKVLVLHGADDPYVPAKDIAAFEEEMRKAGADWQFVAYGRAVHSFTDWDAGGDHSKGAAYSELADRRSWEAMRRFFAELFE